MVNKSIYVLSILTAFLFISSSVFAGNISGLAGGKVTVGVSGTFNETSPETVNAIGGNVTNVDINSNASTIKWQGLYGNVSGNIVLGSGNSVFYEFTNPFYFKTIYFTQGNDVAWDSIVPGVDSEVDTLWGFDSSDVDSASNVFNDTVTVAGIASVPKTDIGNFEMGILKDGNALKSDYVFSGLVKNGTVGFDGGTYDYQMMVPVSSESVPEVYYAYVTLE